MSEYLWGLSSGIVAATLCVICAGVWSIFASSAEID